MAPGAEPHPPQPPMARLRLPPTPSPIPHLPTCTPPSPPRLSPTPHLHILDFCFLGGPGFTSLYVTPCLSQTADPRPAGVSSGRSKDQTAGGWGGHKTPGPGWHPWGRSMELQGLLPQEQTRHRAARRSPPSAQTDAALLRATQHRHSTFHLFPWELCPPFRPGSSVSSLPIQPGGDLAPRRWGRLLHWNVPEGPVWVPIAR